MNKNIALDALLKNGNAETSLRAAVLYQLGRYGDIEKLYSTDAPRQTMSTWDEALLLLAETQLRPGETKEKMRFFLFDTAPGDAVRWALEEIRSLNDEILTGTENAAIEGRLATARSGFNGALILFRVVLEQEPALFLRYPQLLTDLGRCFQFASTGNEGIEVFQKLDRLLTPDGGAAIRCRLYYFMGRISRQRGQYREARDFFAQAIPFAPDTLQSDACIWYILDTALTEGISESADLVKSYIPRWHDGPYFSDILDRLSRYLAAKGQWQTIAEILPFLIDNEGKDGADRLSIAKYAYITGRAIMLSYISPQTTEAVDRAEAARPYFHLAYDAGESSYYYRALSAAFLDLPFLSLPAEANAKAGKAAAFPHPAEMAFLLGFFQTGAASHINPYLQKMAGDLSIPELRALAEAFHDAEMYPELLRLVSDYMGRKDYELNRRDLELYYPRPFLEAVEENARAADLPPELLYGLIRTESAFQADIKSHAGAVGLTQLMPATAAEMAGRIRQQGGPDYTREGAVDLRNPETNVHIGAVYLSYLMNRLEHPLLAILAYNGGMTRVRRWYAAAFLPGDIFLETIEYSETREYGRRVFSAAAAYGYLFYNMNIGELFTDIYK
ncbi:hypothetical protein AGMMS49579_12860 [Spirochaetia bacterium]|nr:hypothetical protein AGMMS49579_12860 [Spirochaetia bacterium]